MLNKWLFYIKQYFKNIEQLYKLFYLVETNFFSNIPLCIFFLKNGASLEKKIQIKFVVISVKNHMHKSALVYLKNIQIR